MTKRPDIDELIAHARTLADQIANGHSNVGTLTPGAEFLRTFAGADSAFYTSAALLVKQVSTPGSFNADRTHGAMVVLLRQWADYAESGLATVQPFALAARIEAADDLTEQAANLLQDKKCHPAVAVMLAGAALEEILRGMHSAKCKDKIARPSIVAYGQSLKTADAIDTGTVKDLTAMADTRNDASHGHFDKITPERAQLFLQQVNFFISKHRDA